MKQIDVRCDKCNEEISENLGYEVMVMKNYVEYKGNPDDPEQDMVHHIDLCEGCYSKFYILFCDLLNKDLEAIG